MSQGILVPCLGCTLIEVCNSSISGFDTSVSSVSALVSASVLRVQTVNTALVLLLHYYNCFMAICPGLPGWAGTRRNIHPLTPILIINHPLSAFSICYNLYHPPWSFYVLVSLFALPIFKSSLVYLLVWHPPHHTPYLVSGDLHCLGEVKSRAESSGVISTVLLTCFICCTVDWIVEYVTKNVLRVLIRCLKRPLHWCTLYCWCCCSNCIQYTMFQKCHYFVFL